MVGVSVGVEVARGREVYVTTWKGVGVRVLVAVGWSVFVRVGEGVTGVRVTVGVWVSDVGSSVAVIDGVGVDVGVGVVVVVCVGVGVLPMNSEITSE